VPHSFELKDAKTSLAEILDALERLVVAQTKSEAVAGEIRLIAEEALTNVMKYGYEGPQRPAILAEIRMEVDTRDVALEIRDRGTAFDPLAQESPALDGPPESRKEGGLGILLLRTLADDVLYRREGDANVLSLKKRLG
jgi:serine/threonine-protein kinase RsbW